MQTLFELLKPFYDTHFLKHFARVLLHAYARATRSRRLQWEKLPPPAVQTQPPLATPAAHIRNLNSPAASSSHTPASRPAASAIQLAAPTPAPPAAQSPAFSRRDYKYPQSSSPLFSTLFQGQNLGPSALSPSRTVTPTSAHTAPPSLRSRCDCIATHHLDNTISNQVVTAHAQRQCRSCFFACATVSIICHCTAIILFLSSVQAVSIVAASNQSTTNHCHYFYACQLCVGDVPQIFAYLQVPPAALLLFTLSFFLAVAARRYFTA